MDNNSVFMALRRARGNKINRRRQTFYQADYLSRHLSNLPGDVVLWDQFTNNNLFPRYSN